MKFPLSVINNGVSQYHFLPSFFFLLFFFLNNLVCIIFIHEYRKKQGIRNDSEHASHGFGRRHDAARYNSIIVFPST